MRIEFLTIRQASCAILGSACSAARRQYCFLDLDSLSLTIVLLKFLHCTRLCPNGTIISTISTRAGNGHDVGDRTSYGTTEARSEAYVAVGLRRRPHYITSQVAYRSVGICERKGCKESRSIVVSTKVVDHIAGNSSQFSVSSALTSSSARIMWICTEIGETRL